MSITLSELREQIRALEAGGGGGGPHAHDWADVTGEPSTFPPAEHDTDHDDRFSLLAHTHPAHADSDHDDRFSLLAHTHPGGTPHTHDWADVTGEPSTFPPAEHDTDHDDRFSLLAHTHPGGAVGILGYAERTANQTGISAITDLTGLSVTVTMAAGRRIKITGKGNVNQVTSTGTIRGIIREGSTSLNDWMWANQPPGTPGDLMGMGEVILTPTAGSHTYKLSLQTSAGTTNLVAASDRPAFILVEDIGAA